MKEKNTLARNIEAADAEKASLDAACKNLLSDKNILAWILKSCVEEYKDCSIQEIMEKYIEVIPEISQTAVHRDENGTRTESVNGERNEDDSITEGRVTYDIKFKALHPYTAMDERKKNIIGGIEECFTMIINVESQSNFYPGYPILKRGIYYGGRMIASQYGTVFTNSHYEKLQKVVSIWICLNPPKYRENSINLYSLQERQLLGTVQEKKENYDLMTVAKI